MRKVAILLVVALALVAMVSAYSSASVANSATMAVRSTDSSLLTLYCGTGVGYKDANCSLTNGVLVFDFRKGLSKFGTGLGVQRNSTYEWEQIFWLYNKSNDKIQFRVDNAGLQYIDVGLLDSTTPKTQWWHWLDETLFVNDGVNQPAVWVTLGADSVVPVGVRFEVPPGATLGEISGSLTVQAKAIP